MLQNVFLKIHQNLEDLDRIERLESWVFQITRNAVIDHFRKSRGEQQDADSEIAIGDAQEENFNSEVAGCLKSLVRCLPVEQREAVSLYEFEGLSQQEIAARHSISLSGAKSRVAARPPGSRNYSASVASFSSTARQRDRVGTERPRCMRWREVRVSSCRMKWRSKNVSNWRQFKDRGGKPRGSP